MKLPALKPGDRVAVITPSSPIRPELLEAGLAKVRELGLEPVVRDDVAARHRFTAGTDDRRFAELSEALADPGIAAIFVARGGYGATPLLSRLHDLRPEPKPILGESDATALGCWALTRGHGWLHGPMVAGSMREGYDEPSLRAALFGAGGETRVDAVALRDGSAEGVLWGGCLSLLAALCGTPWMPRPTRSVLVVEDVGVKPYQVARMLVQLRDAGALQGVAGVVLGDFSDCVQHQEQGYEMGDVLREMLGDALGPVPVTLGWPIGHAQAPHLTLPMGATVRLHVRAGEPARLHWER